MQNPNFTSISIYKHFLEINQIPGSLNVTQSINWFIEFI